MQARQPTIWTIGHSSRPIGEFIDCLRAHEICLLVDVRTIPRSRHNPQFNTDRLAENLKNTGLSSLHMPTLGGLRKARKDSINNGWRNASFRGYADYMQTAEFWNALEELMMQSRQGPSAMMCAEAVPWRCHRSLIADALTSRDWIVRNIISTAETKPHQLTTFAKIEHGGLTYPALADPSSPPHVWSSFVDRLSISVSQSPSISMARPTFPTSRVFPSCTLSPSPILNTPVTR